MVRYYRKFYAREYPLVFLLLVLAGIWLRFLALAAVSLARLGVARVFPR
jgi:hypothetical protein